MSLALRVALAISTLTPVVAHAAEVRRLVIMDVRTSGLASGLELTLSQLVAYTARETLPAAEVMSRADIEALLALEAKKQLLGCDDESCMAQIVGALGADHMLVGSVGRLGARTLVELRLIDVSQGKAVRQLSEGDPEDDATLAEVLGQLTASVLDPARPHRMARLDVDGAGEVRIDGVPIGAAPLRRHAVTAGEHVVQWFAPSDATPVGEERVSARPYQVLKIEPRDLQRGWDLSGLFASFALGNAPVVGIDGERGRQAGVMQTQIGWAFDSGLTLQAGRSLQVLRQPSTSGDGDVQLATDAGLVGVGWQTQGKWRWHFTLDGGPARIYNPSNDFDALNGFAIVPAVALSYSLGRYLQLGMRVSESFVGTEEQDITSTFVGVFVGLPSRGPDHYPQTDFHTSVAFWCAAGAALLGTSLMGAVTDELGTLSLER